MPESYAILLRSGSLSAALRWSILTLGALLSAATAGAADPLQQQAEQHLTNQLAALLQDGDRYAIHINPIDSRLKLAPCASPIHFDNQRELHPGALSFKASCASPKHWSVNLSGSLEIYRPVVTSRQPIARDTLLTAAALTLSERPLSRLRQGYYSSIADVEGHRARRDIRAQQVLLPRLLSPPLLVHRGDEVVIRAGSARLAVEASGIALQDGRLDQQIDVKNSRSERTIRARVTGRGQVSTR